MKRAKRYDIENTDHCNGMKLVPVPGGKYVQHSDHTKIVKELQKLNSKLEMGNWRVAEMNKDGERRCISCLKGFPCICEHEGRYAAHCMSCGWDLTRTASMAHIAKDAEEAKRLWNLLNDNLTMQTAIRIINARTRESAVEYGVDKLLMNHMKYFCKKVKPGSKWDVAMDILDPTYAFHEKARAYFLPKFKGLTDDEVYQISRIVGVELSLVTAMRDHPESVVITPKLIHRIEALSLFDHKIPLSLYKDVDDNTDFSCLLDSMKESGMSFGPHDQEVSIKSKCRIHAYFLCEDIINEVSQSIAEEFYLPFYKDHYYEGI
jgi:hypothetical protein